MPCVSDTTILAYFRGELDAGATSEIESELDSCASCLELMMVVAAAWREDEGALGEGRRAGTTIGRYVVDRQLGAGAMGVVYAAHDPELDRAIALKVMARPTPKLAARFRREAQAMARLDHRNVVPVFDVGGEGAEAFVAMGLIQGVTLREWVKTSRTREAILEVFAQAADGLAAAHERDIVHRDFKPENVLVGDDGVARVGDFGLAQLGAETPVTGGFATGAPMVTHAAGTPAYLAPEVRDGAASGPRADQYAFFVALHEALHGVRPDGAPRPIAPRRLAQALTRGLAVDPAGRFTSMSDVSRELRAIGGSRRRRTLAIAASAGIVVVAASASALAWHARGGNEVVDCERAGSELDTVWSAQHAHDMNAAIRRSHLPYAASAADAVIPAIDRYTHDWRTSAIGACRATHVDHTQSSELLDRRTSCLAQRRADLVAALTSMTAEHAVEIVGALPSVAVCDDVATLAREPVPPKDAATIARIAVVRAQIARAKTNFTAGTFDEGVAIARGVLTTARATGYRPLIAESLEVLGGLVSSSGQPEEALTLLDEALREAEASQSVYEALAIRLRESEVLGTLGKSDEALRVAKLGLAAADGLHAPLSVAQLSVEIGVLESDLGHNQVALDAYKKGLAIYEKEQGPDGVETGHTIGLIGLVEDDLGQHEQAVKDIQRALDIVGRVYGTSHPNYANALSNLSTHTLGDDPQRALDLAQQAHGIRLASLGPDHPEVAMSWSNLAGIKHNLGKEADAKSDVEHALEIKTRVFGADNPSTGVSRLTLAQIDYALKDMAGSLEQATQAVAIFTKALGAEHPYTAQAEAHLGVTLSELGRPSEAIAHLEAAAAHLEPDARYRFEIDLADALQKTGGDRARAASLLAGARVIATAKHDQAALDEIAKVSH